MKGSVIQSFLWLGLGILVLILSQKYNMGTLREPGPGALPFGLGLVISLLSLILLITALRKGQIDKPPVFGKQASKVVAAIAFLVIDTLFLESLGYLIAIFILIVVIMLIMKPRQWISALVLGSISSVSTYVIFDTWLKVSLPKGFLYF
jgi:putative tricarboxylic transport membrane protein